MDVLRLHESQAYAHVDPLSNPQYLFDQDVYKHNDDTLIVANHQLAVEELE